MPTDLERMAVKLRKHLLKRYVLDRSIWPGNETQIEADILDALRSAFDAGAAAMRDEAASAVEDSWEGEEYDESAAKNSDLATGIRALEPRALREPSK